MKGIYKMLIASGVLFAILLCMQISVPADFEWRLTFHPDDRQPYGCQVFDSVMRHSLPNGYEEGNFSFEQIKEMQKHGEKKNLLITMEYYSLNETDLKQLFDLINDGSDVIFAFKDVYYYGSDSVFQDRLGIKIMYHYPDDVRKLVHELRTGKEPQLKTIVWEKGGGYDKGEYHTYPFIVPLHIQIFDDALHPVVLAYSDIDERDNGDYISYSDQNPADEEFKHQVYPIVVKYKMGKGTLTVVTTPMVFTNYGVMSKSLTEYTMRLMSQIADRPVIRTTGYTGITDVSYEEYSPTGFLLKHKPLRVALQLMGVAILLFLVFKARRRQRVIPVVKKLTSNSLEFTQLIGSLYFQRHDNNDLVCKKYSYFAETIRRRLQVDVIKVSDDDEAATLLSQSTGKEKSEVKKELLYLRRLNYTTTPISDAEMKLAIRMMNEYSHAVLE